MMPECAEPASCSAGARAQDPTCAVRARQRSARRALGRRQASRRREPAAKSAPARASTRPSRRHAEQRELPRVWVDRVVCASAVSDMPPRCASSTSAVPHRHRRPVPRCVHAAIAEVGGDRTAPGAHRALNCRVRRAAGHRRSRCPFLHGDGEARRVQGSGWLLRRQSRSVAGAKRGASPVPRRSSFRRRLHNARPRRYYLACEEAVVRHLRERPTVLKRWVDGVEGDFFFQKRVPDTAPAWLQAATVTFPSGATRENWSQDGAHLLWGVNLGVIDWNRGRAPRRSRPSRRAARRPRPRAGCDVRHRPRGRTLRAGVLVEYGLVGFPKTSGSRGIHINVRIEPEHDFTEVRRPPLRSRARSSGACRGARRANGGRRRRRRLHRLQPECARAVRWVRYSVRATAGARVSCPLDWSEVADVEPGELRLDTVPARCAAWRPSAT